MSQITPEEFKTIRESLNLSTRDVADMFDIRGERTVRAWEAGKAPIPDEVGDRLLEIDDALEASLHDLFPLYSNSVGRLLYRCETAEQSETYWPSVVDSAQTNDPKICNAFVARLRHKLMREAVMFMRIVSPPEFDIDDR